MKYQNSHHTVVPSFPHIRDCQIHQNTWDTDRNAYATCNEKRHADQMGKLVWLSLLTQTLPPSKSNERVWRSSAEDPLELSMNLHRWVALNSSPERLSTFQGTGKRWNVTNVEKHCEICHISAHLSETTLTTALLKRLPCLRWRGSLVCRFLPVCLRLSIWAKKEESYEGHYGFTFLSLIS